MRRRYTVSTITLALAACLWTAAFAERAAPAMRAGARNGGTLRVVKLGPFDYVDPSRAYFGDTWAIEFATACKLYNFGESNLKLHAEAATGMPRISKDGRTYTFTVKSANRAMRFADGKRVTAANFAWALNRALRLKPYTPAADFLTDTAATNIVGAADVVAGKAPKARGISVRGNTLTVRLVKPSPVFVVQLTMPFFQAMPLSWGTTVLTEKDLPAVGDTCGPYHLTSSDRMSYAVLQRNRFYRGSRPHHVASIRVTIGVSLASQQLLVERSQQDLGGFPAEAEADLKRRYGPSGRFRRFPQSSTFWLHLNTQSPLFKGNSRLRQAINFALDRRALVQLLGPGVATPTDQILPPRGMPGFRDWKIYPLSPNVAKARRLAKGHLRGGHVLFVGGNDDVGAEWAQIVQQDLSRIGLTVELKLVEPGAAAELTSHRGAAFDMTIGGFSDDYPDPYDFINLTLSGKTIHETGNVNKSYFDVPAWNRRMDAAARLPLGPKRYRAYARLDRDITAGPAPLAPIANGTQLFFMSNRIKRFVVNPVYGVDFAGIELK